jgi:hypothetical protein
VAADPEVTVAAGIKKYPHRETHKAVRKGGFFAHDNIWASESSTVQNRRKKREKLLDKYLTDLSDFKFNRDEANDYD